MELRDEQIETALCIWEAMLDLRSSGEAPKMQVVWDDMGTTFMRIMSIDLVAPVQAIWDGIPDGDFCDTYDWDFVPACMNYVDWDTFTIRHDLDLVRSEIETDFREDDDHADNSG
jgi:hypothetical protein